MQTRSLAGTVSGSWDSSNVCSESGVTWVLPGDSDEVFDPLSPLVLIMAGDRE